jgi:HD-GYP domain-containing protein (c-di-GMP phosphodiesterase class II)
MRRGVLLHDIGKMGIPDTILLKVDPLTPEEWSIMRRHPEYAHELLSPISFLRPALDIPYCHHEKWDGTGYPRGLKGEEIPLAARIFALVDIWEALRSDRPYRRAWSEEQTLEHIRSLAGTHLDPQVVAAFLKLQPLPEQATTFAPLAMVDVGNGYLPDYGKNLPSESRSAVSSDRPRPPAARSLEAGKARIGKP